jgi:hypothetical protein
MNALHLKDPRTPDWGIGLVLYVGLTGLSPEKRFRNHRRGHKAARIVRRHGRRLLPAYYRTMQPVPFEVGPRSGTMAGRAPARAAFRGVADWPSAPDLSRLPPAARGRRGQLSDVDERGARAACRAKGEDARGHAAAPPAGGTYPVAVNGGRLTFKVPSNSNLAVPYDFDGVLSGGVIMGKMVFTATGSTIGSGGFNNVVTQSGSTEISVSLR